MAWAGGISPAIGQVFPAPENDQRSDQPSEPEERVCWRIWTSVAKWMKRYRPVVAHAPASPPQGHDRKAKRAPTADSSSPLPPSRPPLDRAALTNGGGRQRVMVEHLAVVIGLVAGELTEELFGHQRCGRGGLSGSGASSVHQVARAMRGGLSAALTGVVRAVAVEEVDPVGPRDRELREVHCDRLTDRRLHTTAAVNCRQSAALNYSTTAHAGPPIATAAAAAAAAAVAATCSSTPQSVSDE